LVSASSDVSPSIPRTLNAPLEAFRSDEFVPQSWTFPDSGFQISSHAKIDMFSNLPNKQQYQASHFIIFLLVLSREWMGMGEWDDY
jgi:hypothetical protein